MNCMARPATPGGLLMRCRVRGAPEPVAAATVFAVIIASPRANPAVRTASINRSVSPGRPPDRVMIGFIASVAIKRRVVLPAFHSDCSMYCLVSAGLRRGNRTVLRASAITGENSARLGSVVRSVAVLNTMAGPFGFLAVRWVRVTSSCTHSGGIRSISSASKAFRGASRKCAIASSSVTLSALG